MMAGNRFRCGTFQSRRHGKGTDPIQRSVFLSAHKFPNLNSVIFLSSVENAESTRFRSNAKSLFYKKANQPGCSLVRVVNPVLYSHTICHDKEKAMKFYKDSSVLFWFHGYVAFQVCNYSKSFHSKKSLKLSLAVCLFSFLSRWLLFTQNKLRSHLFSLYGPRINFINRS